MSTIEPGAEFVFSYPFVRSTYQSWDGPDEEGAEPNPVTVPCWKPGVEFVNTPSGDTDCIAHGLGFQRVTVISKHKPGKFPARVFYVRKWEDPDGKVWGKGKLHITTEAAFKRLVRGYRHEFELVEGA